MCEISISIPEEVLMILRKDPESMARSAKLCVAIDLYLNERVSVGYCADISGLSEEEFIQELGKRNISIFQFETEEELARDIENA